MSVKINEKKLRVLLQPEDEDIKAAKEIVERRFKTSIMSKNRKRQTVDARMAYTKLLREIGITFKKIGSTLGKDHSSIVHYAQSFDRLMEFNSEVRLIYTECVNEYFKNREPIMLLNEKDIKRELVEAKKKVSSLMIEQDKLLEMQLKYERIKPIVDLIHERTPRGKERWMERKINLMLNGLENYED